MVFDRRQIMIGGLGMGAGLAAAAGPRVASARGAEGHTGSQSVFGHGVRPNSKALQTDKLQKAIDAAARAGVILHIPAGVYRTGKLNLRTNSIISGVAGQSVLRLAGNEAMLTARSARNIRLTGVVLDTVSVLLYP